MQTALLDHRWPRVCLPPHENPRRGPPACCRRIGMISTRPVMFGRPRGKMGPMGRHGLHLAPPIAAERRPPHAARGGSCHPPGCSPCRWACLHGTCKRISDQRAQPTRQISAWGVLMNRACLTLSACAKAHTPPSIPQSVAPTGQAGSGQLGEPCSPRRTAEPVRLAARYERHRCNPY